VARVHEERRLAQNERGLLLRLVEEGRVRASYITVIVIFRKKGTQESRLRIADGLGHIISRKLQWGVAPTE